MAVDISTVFPAGKFNPVSGAYPTGSIKDETVPGSSDDGSPLSEKWGNDFEGFKQAVMREAGIDISGSTTSDTALLSQILIGLKSVVPTVDKKDWPTVANDADAANDILFVAGKIPAKGGSIVLDLDSDVVKQKDVAWAISTDATPAGGLFPGASLTNVAYSFIIRRDSDGVIDAGFDDNAAASNIPVGWSAYRLLAKLPISGGAFIAFDQTGDQFDFVTPIQELSTTNPSTTGSPITLSVPPDVIAIVSQTLIHNAASVYAWARSAAQANTAPGSNDHDVQVAPSSQVGSMSRNIKADSSSQIQYRASLGVISSYQIYTQGWVDQRID
jgi:hypothetical protein